MAAGRFVAMIREFRYTRSDSRIRRLFEMAADFVGYKYPTYCWLILLNRWIGINRQRRAGHFNVWIMLPHQMLKRFRLALFSALFVIRPQNHFIHNIAYIGIRQIDGFCGWAIFDFVRTNLFNFQQAELFLIAESKIFKQIADLFQNFSVFIADIIGFFH